MGDGGGGGNFSLKELLLEGLDGAGEEGGGGESMPRCLGFLPGSSSLLPHNSLLCQGLQLQCSRFLVNSELRVCIYWVSTVCQTGGKIQIFISQTL